jgi:ergothioneine biosynthesis protein EgtB
MGPRDALDARRVRTVARSGEELRSRYIAVRSATERLCEHLSPEDCVAQSMPEASPVSWHLAHTSWFFETFVLLPAGLAPHHAKFSYLFNSYYNTIGERVARGRRGLITRPGLAEIREYRNHVDREIAQLLATPDRVDAGVVQLGLQHEEQHQELILTDVKHLFAQNPLQPAYAEPSSPQPVRVAPLEFVRFEGGVVPIGHAGTGFFFDNEGPRHDVLLRSFELASRPVTSGEFLAFIEADGYRRPELWLSDGWDTVAREGWTAPLYWERDGAQWRQFTLRGALPLDPSEPVCHVSFYEADAYARFAGARLPLEAEWETAAREQPIEGNFVENGALHPRPTAERGGSGSGRVRALFGDVWEWTASPYVGYPGYRPTSGALGEYNGKFMCNQWVLRGGSCASPRSHLRATYRNFFAPNARWQFSGIRLARDAAAD